MCDDLVETNHLLSLSYWRRVEFYEADHISQRRHPASPAEGRASPGAQQHDDKETERAEISKQQMLRAGARLASRAVAIKVLAGMVLTVTAVGHN